MLRGNAQAYFYRLWYRRHCESLWLLRVLWIRTSEHLKASRSHEIKHTQFLVKNGEQRAERLKLEGTVQGHNWLSGMIWNFFPCFLHSQPLILCELSLGSNCHDASWKNHHVLHSPGASNACSTHTHIMSEREKQILTHSQSMHMDTPVLFINMEQHMYSSRLEDLCSKQVVLGGSLVSSTLSYDDSSDSV